MTIILTPEQSALYDEGGFPAWRVEEDIREDLERRNMHDDVVVEDAHGNVLFAMTRGGVR